MNRQPFEPRCPRNAHRRPSVPPSPSARHSFFLPAERPYHPAMSPLDVPAGFSTRLASPVDADDLADLINQVNVAEVGSRGRAPTRSGAISPPRAAIPRMTCSYANIGVPAHITVL